jgi:hypothetical protein
MAAIYERARTVRPLVVCLAVPRWRKAEADYLAAWEEGEKGREGLGFEEEERGHARSVE